MSKRKAELSLEESLLEEALELPLTGRKIRKAKRTRKTPTEISEDVEFTEAISTETSTTAKKSGKKRTRKPGLKTRLRRNIQTKINKIRKIINSHKKQLSQLKRDKKTLTCRKTSTHD